MTQAFPLQWPAGWPRTNSPRRSQFRTTHGVALRNLYTHLRMLGATNTVVSTNIELKRDGTPYARQLRVEEDSGVAVYFTLNGDEQCIPCDKWYSVGENIQAIAKTIEALRGLERWGAQEMVNAAFRGFKALPETIIMGTGTARAWHEVLEVSPSCSLAVAEAAFKRLARIKHPDTGGNDQEFIELKTAWEQAKENCRE